MFARTSHSVLLTVLTVLLVFGGVNALASKKTDVMTVNKQGAMLVPEETRVGRYFLKVGSYKVFCEHTDSGHRIVFVRLEEAKPYYSGSNDATSDITKVECRMEKLRGFAERSEFRLSHDSSGQRYLKEVTIKGEDVLHSFE